MMKVFREGSSSYSSKVNFVDDNDVYVGYDLKQSCCEHAGWFVSDAIATNLPSDEKMHNSEGLDGYSFDKDFYKNTSFMKNHDYGYDQLGEGGCAVFRLTDGSNEKFLHLFNCHNGYYAHGFEVKHGGEVVVSGYL